ncbi:MAG: GGDEF domain-containing protein [Patescibacteria group bacterium]|nr:GGDEF domain-containing protein [Patescibacteria group bacterium]
MSEGNEGTHLGEVKKRYKPLRERSEKLLLESGVRENTRVFRRARAKFAREAYMAGIDEVTKLPVRGLFETRLQEEFLRSERSETPLTMCIIDLNNLREINLKGYPEGDRALRNVAEKIIRSIRKTDYAARYGGDEFAILFPGATEDVIPTWWNRFTSEMQGSNHTVTASAIQINRGNIDEARTKLTETLKVTKDQNNHSLNAFAMAA